jgi:hypothetical protein
MAGSSAGGRRVDGEEVGESTHGVGKMAVGSDLLNKKICTFQRNPIASWRVALMIARRISDARIRETACVTGVISRAPLEEKI